MKISSRPLLSSVTTLSVVGIGSGNFSGLMNMAPLGWLTTAVHASSADFSASFAFIAFSTTASVTAGSTSEALSTFTASSM